MNYKQKKELYTCWQVVYGQLSLPKAAEKLKLSPNGVGKRFISLLRKEYEEQNKDEERISSRKTLERSRVS